MFRSLLLGSVAIVASTSSLAANSKGQISECKLLELAYKVTLMQKDQAVSDIMVDCPGYEHWDLEMTTRDHGNAYRLAMSVQLPTKVELGGDAARQVFQRMISRGVPLDVAQGMVETRAFDKAVEGYTK